MELFIYEKCPFCLKVRSAMKDLGYIEGDEIKIIDAHQEINKEKLLKIGGKVQVPFLIDNQINMYESDKIIDYLKQKKR